MALWSRPRTDTALIDRRAVEPDLARAPRSVALRVVDDAPRQLGSRRFVSSAEVVDLLLEVRWAIAFEAASVTFFEELSGLEVR